MNRLHNLRVPQFPFFAIAAVALSAVAGWVNHLIWSFGILMADTQSAGQIVLAIIGVVAPPVGAIHGVYLWFV